VTGIGGVEIYALPHPLMIGVRLNRPGFHGQLIKPSLGTLFFRDVVD